MNNSNTQYRSTGVSIPGLLGIVFVVMKLMGWGAVATWSWLWVLSPFWIPLAIVFAILFVLLIIVGVAKLLE